MLALLALLAAADSGSYWQQRVAYRITAALDEPAGVLTGSVVITYVNQSPDTLYDFSVHQYLNAFRPGSRWAAADSAEGRVRFQHLAEPDYAFERITAATLMGVARRPDYPYAPDSTVAHWTLPRPLAPGDSMTVAIDWRARPSTVPRRQGRSGRRFDFAQWYPKVVVYDRYGWEDHPLYPAGEFYGEFATYDVTLDLPQDQVIGATGVPVCGDPGWERARAVPGRPIDYQRDRYGDVPRDCPPAVPGRKTVRFRAEQVHHFAFSLNPEYLYEEGRYGDVVVRVLYQPGDRKTWGNGIAVQRTVTALAWLDTLYGAFAWPQLTNVHRIEGGGTEFPMMVMDGGASLGLILHEVGHNYTMGILANNEWREGWLDEGFTSFQTGWYFETHGGGSEYPGLEADLALSDVDRWSEPVSLVSERYRDFVIYNEMIYNKAQLFYEQLRYVVGDEAMRRILRAYYARWRLRHVDEAAFRAVCEAEARQDLGWLFGSWLHGTPLIDYAMGPVTRRRLPDGTWETTVTVERRGDGVMPVEIGDSRRIYARADGQAATGRLVFRSAERPGRLMLDPRLRAHDWNMLNNGERSWHGRAGAADLKVDNPIREEVRRDQRVDALFPVAWYNDYGGTTVGLRLRTNYLDRFDQGLFLGTAGLDPDATERAGIYARWKNPVSHPVVRGNLAFSGWWVEGRAGAALSWDQSLQQRYTQRSAPRVGADLVWMATTNLSYLDRRLWENAGTVEGGPWWSVTTRAGRTTWRARLGARAGVLYRYPGPGLASSTRYDVEGFLRATAEASVRQPLWHGATLGVRAYGGGYLGHSTPPLQRRVMLQGADPYETFTNPFLRSAGALLVRPDFHYHAPGGTNLRGFAPDAGGRWAASLNLEGAQALFTRQSGFVREVALTGFVDAGVADTLAIPSATPGRWYTTLYDGGAGVTSRHRLGELDWRFRVEFPLVVNRWDYAAQTVPGEGRLAFRWQVSLSASF